MINYIKDYNNYTILKINCKKNSVKALQELPAFSHAFVL